ncbi:MAG: hypothetical protein AB1489_35905, partial [Acidobacteriota bacterium]
FSLMELAIAIIVLGILAAAWIQTATSAVKNGRFLQAASTVKTLAEDKATELIKQADTLVQQIPAGQKSIGSITPNEPIAGFYDQFDFSGKPIIATSRDKEGSPLGGGPLGGPLGGSEKEKGDGGPIGGPRDDHGGGGPIGGPRGNLPIAKFTRQWLVIKDQPSPGEVTVLVSVVYADSNRITRIAKAVKAEGITITP